ncbi:MAG: FAD-dependent oxidoreductase [Acidobacteriota bacterium]
MPDGYQAGNGGPRIGVYVCRCGINIASKVDVAEVVAFAQTLPGVVVAREYPFMCSDPGQELIQKDIAELGVNRVVVASCSPLMHEPTFRGATAMGGVNPFLFQMANIREQVSWVTLDKGAATEKAKALVAGAVSRVWHHVPLERKRVEVRRDVLVVGGGIAGIHAALTAADSGKTVYLVEREPSIGGHMAMFDKTFPTLDCAACILTPKMTAVASHPNIKLLSYSEVEKVDGFVGNFTVTVRRKARYVDVEECTGCGECEKVCPVEVPSEFNQGLSTRKAIYRPFPQAVPGAYTISRRGMPPCQAGCPLHQAAQAYVALIAQGRFDEALKVILRDNPLPAICGRVCTHPCMTHCTRCGVDEPVSLPALKRFVVDQAGDYDFPRPGKELPQRVAIVGSGPAGLACAFELRQRGYQVTVFEKSSLPGGMLTLGIPAFRLPREVIAADMRRFERLGVGFRLGVEVGKHITVEELRRQFAAVFVGIGAHRERKLNVPGEELPGVFPGVDFLRRVNLGETVKLSGHVVVVGGGNSALDAARTALRCGAQTVTIAYRRTRNEMPADPAEIEAAEAEGVRFEFLVAPVAFVGADRLSAVRLQRMQLGEPDSSGRPRPVPIPGSEFEMPADAVIVTVGQEAEAEKLGLPTERWGTLRADADTLETPIPGVFAGGDCVTGPDVVVTAMAAGKKAAESIHRFIQGQDLRAGREREVHVVQAWEVDTEGLPVKPRVPVPEIPLPERRSFREVHTGYTREQAMEEAKRCLACGICCDCQLCATVCERKAIHYDDKDELIELPVGAIIVATGFAPFDPKRIPEYGYGRYPNVFTSLEVERLVNASGPTGGEVRLRDGRIPKSVGIIHCVGSRDQRYHKYCSRVCCMYSLKLAHLIHERTGAEVYNFYIDMRTPGKGYEEFYLRLMEEGVHCIRGRVAEVTDWAMSPEEEGKLVLRVEDTNIGVVRRIPVDMVVLSVALEARPDAEEVRRTFNMSCSAEGWFLERHPKLAPVATFTDGVWVAGACQGPKDIPDTVAQAGAAAGEALALLDRGYVELEPNVAWIDEEACSGCKTCVPLCPYSAITFDGEKGKSRINEALCKGCGTCVAACPSGAAQQQLFTDRQILAEIKGVLAYV